MIFPFDPFVFSVVRTTTLRPNTDVAKSIISSAELTHCFVSPGLGALSHSLSASPIIFATCESLAAWKIFFSSSIFEVEKGFEVLFPSCSVVGIGSEMQIRDIGPRGVIGELTRPPWSICAIAVETLDRRIATRGTIVVKLIIMRRISTVAPERIHREIFFLCIVLERVESETRFFGTHSMEMPCSEETMALITFWRKRVPRFISIFSHNNLH
uniref:Uncharacterized protein n=1 Tax=Solanum lycopersicum TaxID=4081 RepID=A0A3Q7GCI3_SOLLC